MSRLNLKSTPSDRENRQWRRAQRFQKLQSSIPSPSSSAPRTRHHTSYSEQHVYHYTVPMDHDPTGHTASLPSLETQDHLRAQLFGALDDGAPLDTFLASSAPIAAMQNDSESDLLRRAQAQHQAALMREQKLRERRERDRAMRKERERQEKLKEERRERKRLERELKDKEAAWSSYRATWDALNVMPVAETKLHFKDLPWPVFPPPIDPHPLTREGISIFLLASFHSPDKSRKQRIRDALLAYHPDRFIGRFLGLVDQSEREMVETGIRMVVRALNTLLEES